jgi:hypothetical protein
LGENGVHRQLIVFRALFFSSSCGLRQGNPLSTLRFVSVMEALDISAAMRVGLLSRFSIGTENVGGIDISHILFADGTLIFCGANPDHLRNLRSLF